MENNIKEKLEQEKENKTDPITVTLKKKTILDIDNFSKSLKCSRSLLVELLLSDKFIELKKEKDNN